MPTKRLPNDPEAERAVVGMLLVGTTAREYLFSHLTEGDFFTPSLGAMFEACRELHGMGRKADATTVRDHLHSHGFTSVSAGDIVSALADAPPSSHAPEYAEIVARLAVSRRAMGAASDAVEALGKGQHPQGVIDSLVADLQQIDSPILEKEPDDVSFGDLLALPPEHRKPWVIPGLMRQDWRLLAVGREGDGKSVLLRQIGVTSSLGVHPFTGEPIPPTRTLLVDLENPQDEIRRWIHRITAVCGGGTGEGRLWHRQGGIDIRSRSERADFEGVLRVRKPNLVIIGPKYKLYSTSARETDELVAHEVQDILEDLRIRYGFALIVEDHAPHGYSGTRDLRPFGSSLWLRWAELGFKLEPFDWNQVPARMLDIKRFRGDRVEHAWPKHLHWGLSNQLPWQGTGYEDDQGP
jgi:replicative DNA helicase